VREWLRLTPAVAIAAVLAATILAAPKWG